jgi:predicted KAP-like P-loop ATPase
LNPGPSAPEAFHLECACKPCDLRIENVENTLDDFREWLNKRYSKSWANQIFYYARKYHSMINGSLREINSFSKEKRNRVLKSLIALSKYLGLCKEFKKRIKNHGIK